MTIAGWILIIVLLVAAVGFIVSGKKRRWYKVYLANNDTLMVYRKMSDWWWRDTTGIMGFRLVDGRHIKVSKHWIIKVEEAPYPEEEKSEV